jgi:hypothetical protein
MCPCIYSTDNHPATFGTRFSFLGRDTSEPSPLPKNDLFASTMTFPNSYLFRTLSYLHRSQKTTVPFLPSNFFLQHIFLRQLHSTMPRRKSERLIRSRDANENKASNSPSVLKFVDDEAEEDKPQLKEKQTTFSMALPAVTPDAKIQHSRTSKVSPPRRPPKKTARITRPRILATPEFGHHPMWGETPEELQASINFVTPRNQDAYGNMLDPDANNDKKMPANTKTGALLDNNGSGNIVAANSSLFVGDVNQQASKPASALSTVLPVKSVDSNATSSDDSMANYTPVLARPRRSIVRNTGYVYYEHLHGGLALFRVEDSQSGRDAYIEQVVHGLRRPEFRNFQIFPGWLSLHANTNDKLPGNKDPYFARGILLFKGSIKVKAAQTTTQFFKTFTSFLNNWTYAGGRLDCAKEEGGHWYHYLPSHVVDRTPKDKRKLCDLLCISDSLSIVKSIATETLGYSTEHYQQDKKFTTMYFNPPYTPAMMAALHMDTPNG